VFRTARRRRRATAIEAPPDKKLVLHVGCGPPDHVSMHEQFRTPEWHEVRLDIDPGVQPDVVASIIDMPEVPSESVDAVYSHHNIEHVFFHEVPLVLGEFFRVLRPGGEVLLATPDLQSVARAIARGELETTLYTAPVGDIAALDVVYGLRADIATGREYMAHRTGFTMRTLTQKFNRAGFVHVHASRGPSHSLWVRAQRPAGRAAAT
jgi:SAM-dependent methyltransferase